MRMTSFKRWRDLVAKPGEQSMQFVEAAVNVADDVEGTMIEFAIVPERLPLDRNGLDFFRRRELVNVPEAFAFQVAD